MKNVLIFCLLFCFFHLKAQNNDLSSTIPIGSKVTISLETKDSINFTYKFKNIETFSKTVNADSKESQSLFENVNTNCIDLVFCHGTYEDGSQKVFLFVKNWYTFPIKYNAQILRDNKTQFESTSVMPLFPKVLSREDWPYKIGQIKLSDFQKMNFQNTEILKPADKPSNIRYIGTGNADSAFVCLFKLIDSKIGDLNLSQVDLIEQKMESKDITPNYYFELGRDIYPNKKRFKLETPRTYLRIEDSTFTNQIEYYYTKSNGSIKAILFEWNETKNNSDFFSLTERMNDKPIKFQNKFNKIEDFITSQMGKPTKRKIESLKHKDPFRDDVVWKSENGLVVYMFMFGNESQQYRQIRMAVYKE